MANNPNAGTQGDVRFRCKDVGFQNCPWETRGKSEQEIMPEIERGREAHGIDKIDDNTRDRVRNAMQRAA